ncbi:hypothetical protein GGF46_002964 [Coemansia sp. RSA 552]|nr:hypothetical protein GGF46_002964 [Coemansia sp. RSA 552]
MDTRLLSNESIGAHRIRVSIDRGGTFTDCVGTFPVAETGQTRTVVVKLLSEDPAHYADAPTEGIRRILEAATGQAQTRSVALDTSNIEWIRMGTTIKRPDVLSQTVVGVDERVTLAANADAETQRGRTGEHVRVEQAPDEAVVRVQLKSAYEAGARSAAVCLAHAYTFSAHEEAVGRIAAEVFDHVTLSSQLSPMVKLVPRAHSATADAYLTPGIRRYVRGFSQGFDAGLAGVRVDFMQSDGGLTPAAGFSGLRAVLSGPAGGVVGYAATTFSATTRVPLIGFDMGGTSTDVSRYAGRLEHVLESTTAGVTIQAPQLDIHTVAAGGGSRLFFRNGLMAVGPESAGAHPGPACYRKHGPPALTDANLLLGRLRADHFPHIFGPTEDKPLDMEASRAALGGLADEVAQQTGERRTAEETALGFVRVANEAMSRPIRALTEARGHRVQSHALACFGGAGGQHACAVAASLGITRVFVHRLASVLSAHGLALAEVVRETQAPTAAVWPDETLVPRLDDLARECHGWLADQGFTPTQISEQRFMNLRYEGTDTALMVPDHPDQNDYAARFEEMHCHEFGFVLQDRRIIVDDLRVRATGAVAGTEQADIDAELATLPRRILDPPGAHAAFIETVPVYFTGGWQDTAVLRLVDLAAGDVVRGPAMVVDQNSTVLVEPGWRATATTAQVVLDRDEEEDQAEPDGGESQDQVEQDVDPTLLAVFAHRFMGIAEQMGRTLEKTSVSTNIKERLDFSCALFDARGRLVANAPHIPVHLGSMSHAVQFQLARAALVEGDVVLANHPQAGGSHLPDITVITPVFASPTQIAFFVASRGHHADIGGIAPGSMPPASRDLAQEGARTMGFKLVSAGHFQEAELRRFLVDEPARHPGCSGTRCYADVVSDLKAQIAANRRGITLIRDLCTEFTLPAVHKYMSHIQRTAEEAVRAVLRRVYADKVQGRGSESQWAVVQASDSMDDGSRICLRVSISAAGAAVFDFTGTSSQVYSNLNAPPSVTYSAIIYCLRCMVASDLPLNHGCLAPVKVNIPAGSLLSPDSTAAVVGGNVLTSQRLCDVILAAFGAAAASQGCMNNLTFGVPTSTDAHGQPRDGWGYYETIAGGHGAGPHWAGQSGVHTNMTNTRITDPEILERRYPVILRQFSLRPASGGPGRFPGGDGCIREIEFRQPIHVSLLTERRVIPPPGLAGGSPGACGINLWKRRAPSDPDADPDSDPATRPLQTLNLGPKISVDVSPGDRIVIMTPGGGGYGTPPEHPSFE